MRTSDVRVGVRPNLLCFSRWEVADHGVVRNGMTYQNLKSDPLGVPVRDSLS
jgi:hypothetical protein